MNYLERQQWGIGRHLIGVTRGPLAHTIKHLDGPEPNGPPLTAHTRCPLSWGETLRSHWRPSSCRVPVSLRRTRPEEHRLGSEPCAWQLAVWTRLQKQAG